MTTIRLAATQPWKGFAMRQVLWNPPTPSRYGREGDTARAWQAAWEHHASRARDRLAWPAAILVILGLSVLGWMAVAMAVRAVIG